MDRSKFQYEGMKWLMELELLNHPQAINTIKFNILTVSKHVKEVELLIYRENKSMLVLLELGWMGRTFHKKQIFTEVEERLSQLLPTFRYRVTDDPMIMNLAIAKVKKALTGGSSENVISATSVVAQPSAEPISSEPAAQIANGDSVDSQPSVEESSKTETTIRDDVGGNDSKKE